MANPLDELLRHKHGASRELLAALRPEDLDRARDAAMEHGNPDRIKAIDLLVSARAAGTDALLVTILRNREESSAVRAAAAGQLGRLRPNTQPENVFLGLLQDTEDPAIRMQIAGALGRIGTTEAIEPLGRLVERSEGAVKLQADFARSVIAARYGVSGYDLPAVDPREALPLDSNRARPFTFESAPLEEALVGWNNIGADSFGLRPEPESSHVVQCGPARMLVGLNPEGVHGDSTSSLTSRPFILGLVADRSPEDGSYSVRWLLLSWPGEKASLVSLALHRPSGDRILQGTLKIGLKRGEFELRSVRRPGGVPVLLRGRFADNVMRITEALSEPIATARRSPTPTKQPRPYPDRRD